MKKQEQPHRGVVNFERRRHPRIDVDLPIEYNRTELGAKEGRVLNASEGGLLLYLPERIEVEQLLALKLELPSASKWESIEVLVQVAWIDINGEENWGEYRTGVRFVDVAPEDLKKLRGFLRNLSRSK